MDKVRVAVIGCGGISRAHFNGHAACPGSEVVYAVDIDEDKAKEKAEVMGCKWHTDYKAILDEVDAVDICTAPHLHAEMTVEAARKGKHVLTEKIMARTLPEAHWMIEEVEKAGVVFMVAFVLRYRPEFQVMHDACHEGRIGDIRQGYIHTQQMMSKPAIWRQNPFMFPMGAFLSHGCHYVDQLYWCLGPVVETANVSHALTLHGLIPGGDDTNCAIFRHENGAVSAYVESWAIPYRTAGIRFEVYGTEGSLQLKYQLDGGRVVSLYNKDGQTDIFEFDPSKQDHMDAFGGAKDMQGQIAHFIECCQTGKQPVTHGREGIKPMEIVIAATEAEKERKTLRIDEFINRPENTRPWDETEFRNWLKREYNYVHEG